MKSSISKMAARLWISTPNCLRMLTNTFWDFIGQIPPIYRQLVAPSRKNPFHVATAPMIVMLQEEIQIQGTFTQQDFNQYLEKGRGTSVLAGNHIRSAFERAGNQSPEKKHYKWRPVVVYNHMPIELAIHLAHENNHVNDMRKLATDLDDMMNDFRRAYETTGFTPKARALLKARYIRDSESEDKLKDFFAVCSYTDEVWAIAKEVTLGGESYKINKPKKSGEQHLVPSQPEKSLVNIRSINGLPPGEQLRLLNRVVNEHLTLSQMKTEATQLKRLIEVKEAFEHCFGAKFSEIAKERPHVTSASELAKWLTAFDEHKKANNIRGRKAKDDVANVKAIPPSFMKWAESQKQLGISHGQIIREDETSVEINGKTNAVYHASVVAVPRKLAVADASVCEETAFTRSPAEATTWCCSDRSQLWLPTSKTVQQPRLCGH
eukprot:TRINITY_DN7745_c0_g1_i1.p1 TRINITY_DN7745_c0_g1~~TRINITY_DN7745_c0_g1_i1.p1  ORF type:complete len:435 (-),score=62.78 TRINITY_DN7745_c0_g1_i1:111-1415(-)